MSEWTWWKDPMLRSMNPTSPPSFDIPGAGVSEIFDVKSGSVETPKPEVGVVAPSSSQYRKQVCRSRRLADACKISDRSLLPFSRYRNFSACFPNPPGYHVVFNDSRVRAWTPLQWSAYLQNKYSWKIWEFIMENSLCSIIVLYDKLLAIQTINYCTPFSLLITTSDSWLPIYCIICFIACVFFYTIYLNELPGLSSLFHYYFIHYRFTLNTIYNIYYTSRDSRIKSISRDSQQTGCTGSNPFFGSWGTE